MQSEQLWARQWIEQASTAPGTSKQPGTRQPTVSMHRANGGRPSRSSWPRRGIRPRRRRSNKLVMPRGRRSKEQQARGIASPASANEHTGAVPGAIQNNVGADRGPGGASMFDRLYPLIMCASVAGSPVVRCEGHNLHQLSPCGDSQYLSPCCYEPHRSVPRCRRGRREAHRKQEKAKREQGAEDVVRLFSTGYIRCDCLHLWQANNARAAVGASCMGAATRHSRTTTGGCGPRLMRSATSTCSWRRSEFRCRGCACLPVCCGYIRSL